MNDIHLILELEVRSTCLSMLTKAYTKFSNFRTFTSTIKIL